MTPANFNRTVRKQLDQLLREKLLSEQQYRALTERYALTRWDWTALGKWFAIFGALSTAAGMLILVHEFFEFTLQKLALLLFLLTVGLFAASRRLRERPWTARGCELMGGLGLIGLSFTLGTIYSSGSGNWPALLLIDLCILLPLAYALRNVLLLVLSATVFFVWFGGMTGYSSGWGAYWFGMNYPLRFLLAGIVIALIGLLHRRAEHRWLAKYPGFFYVWLAGGVFFSEMALWLMSLFGNFDPTTSYGHRTSGAELLLFNVLWAGGNALLLWLGARYYLQMLRGFAVTFLIIQGYTVYFSYIAPALDFISAAALAGGAALAIVATLEKNRRAAAAGRA